MAKWYYRSDDNTLGPISSAELKVLVSDGIVIANTHVCQTGSQRWIPAAQIKGLFPESMMPPPPPPSPTVVRNPTESSIEFQESARPAGQTGWRMLKRIFLFAAFLVTAGVSAWVAVTVMSVLSRSSFVAQPESNGMRDAVEQAGRSDSQTREAEMMELENAAKELEDATEELKAEKSRLEQEKRNLEDEIQQLTTLRERLKSWQNVDLVVINPAHVAVGVQTQADGQLRISHVAKGEFAQDAIAVAAKSGADFVPNDFPLARELAGALPPGSRIGEPYSSRIREYYHIHQGPPQNPSEAQWVLFFDQLSQTWQSGLFETVDRDSFTYIRCESPFPTVTVSHDQILSGSAMKGTFNELLPVIDECQILDQCLMQVAHEMRSLDGKPNAKSVFSSVIVRRPKREQPRTIATAIVEQTPSPNDSRTLKTIRFFVRLLQGAGFGSQRASPQALETSVFALENEVSSKLRELKVNAVTRNQFQEHLQELGGKAVLADSTQIGSQFLESRSNVISHAKSCHISHALIITVSEPETYGRYHFNVELVDSRSGRVQFSMNADRVDESISDDLDSGEAIDRGERHREYYLDSGRLALIQAKNIGDRSYQPIESPPLVPRRNRNSRLRRPDLVYIESAQGTSPIQYRSLFTKRRYTLATELVDSVKYVDDPRDVPQYDRFRYLVCRIMRRAMPSAGRVITAQGNRVTISIGRDGGVLVGDTMRLLRYFDDRNAPVIDELRGEESERLLPIRLRVTEIHDHYCVAIVRRSGFEDVWPEDYALQVGDIVIPTIRQPFSIGLLPPVWKDPNVGDEIATNIRRNLIKLDWVKLITGQTSVSLTDELGEALVKFNLPVRFISDPFNQRNRQTYTPWKDGPTVHEHQLKEMSQLGVTHALGGFIQPISNMEYRVQLGLLPMSSVGETAGHLDDIIELQIRRDEIPE